MRLFINILVLTIISACSSMQNSNTEGEYRYVPITEALKKLSDEEVAIRLRTASLTCENDMLKVYVPSRTVDPEGCLLYTSPSPRDH